MASKELVDLLTGGIPTASVQLRGKEWPIRRLSMAEYVALQNQFPGPKKPVAVGSPALDAMTLAEWQRNEQGPWNRLVFAAEVGIALKLTEADLGIGSFLQEWSASDPHWNATTLRAYGEAVLGKFTANEVSRVGDAVNDDAAIVEKAAQGN